MSNVDICSPDVYFPVLAGQGERFLFAHRGDVWGEPMNRLIYLSLQLAFLKLM